MAYSARLGSPSQDRPPSPIAAESRLIDADLVDQQHLPDQPDHHQADHVRQEEQGPEQAGEAAAPVHQQSEAEAGDIKAGHQQHDIEQGDLQALQEQRVGQHAAVIGQADEAVAAEAGDAEKAEAERQQHRPADEHQQAERVGQHEQITGDPLPMPGRQAATLPDACRWNRRWGGRAHAAAHPSESPSPCGRAIAIERVRRRTAEPPHAARARGEGAPDGGAARARGGAAPRAHPPTSRSWPKNPLPSPLPRGRGTKEVTRSALHHHTHRIGAPS